MGEKIEFTTLLCSKKTSALDKEIELLGIDPKDPVAIIPKDLVQNDLQFLQGIIHYYLYREDMHVFNEGLFLSMLITGEKQFKDIVEKLKKTFETNEHYYLVIYLGKGEFEKKSLFRVPENCVPYNIIIDFKNLRNAVKNIRALFELL